MGEERIQRGYQRSNRMKMINTILMLIIVALLVVIFYTQFKNQKQDTADVSSQLSSEASSQMDSSALAAAAEADQWYLKLVNQDNPLPDDFTPDVALIEPKYARDKGMQYDSRAVGALNSMCADAEKDGVNLLVISAYRSIARQTQLYNNKVNSYVDDGYGEEEAKQAAATVVAIPGTGEHNLGLAIDFNSVEESFERSAQSKWLVSHATDYGFVLRYPKEKQEITKIIYEPWHYRYVGVEHAKKMNELGYCLEEYIAYLKNGGSPATAD